MPTQPPYRMPCGAVAGKQLFYFGNPAQHAAQPLLVDKYTNTTVVENWNTEDTDHPTIPPYERWKDNSGDGGCAVNHCVPDGAPCSAWPKPYTENTFMHTPGDQVNFAVSKKRGFKNVMARRYWSGSVGYMHSTGPDTTQVCEDNSLKKWLSYQRTAPQTKYLNLAINATFKLTSYIWDEAGTPTETVVYDHAASVNQSINPTSGLLTISDLAVSPSDDRNKALALIGKALWTRSAIIDRMTTPIQSPTGTGTFTYADNSYTVTQDFGDGYGPVVIEQCNWDIAAGTFLRKLWFFTGPYSVQSGEESVTLTDDSFTYEEWDGTPQYVPGLDAYELNGVEHLTVTGTFSGANNAASLLGDIKTLLALWPLNDDKLYPWRTDLKVSVAPMVCRDEILTQGFTTDVYVKNYGAPIPDDTGFDVGSTIGDATWDGHCGLVLSPDPNTGVCVEAIDLNVNTGDVVNITVTGTFSYATAVASFSVVGGTLPPGVSFDTSTGIISGTVSSGGHYGITIQVTAAQPAATGNIIGAPKPAGYQNFFAFNFEDWRGCCFHPADNPDANVWSWYQLGWGQDVTTFNANTGCSLPLNATFWNNWFESANKPQGAWIFHADNGNYYATGCHSSDDSPSGAGDSSYIVACKYAEILDGWYSQNFALPAGGMKFFYDETRVVCATIASGSGEGTTLTIKDALGNTPADDTDFTGIWGGPVVSGFYDVASYSGGTLTLGTKRFNVPSDWASKSKGDEASCFGKLRWSDKPALLGRIAITPDGTGNTFTFAAAQPAFGMNASTHQEQVDLWDASMALVASGVTATRVDDSHFTTTAAYATARYVTITGAKWYMNDTDSKGDYAVLTFASDFRTGGEITRLASVTDCAGDPVAAPTMNAGGGPASLPFASFSQTPGCLPFTPCAPRVVCISPNGETWPNGVTYGFPDSFTVDEQYGSKWWGYVQSTMTDLYWQAPHRPCNIEICAQWKEDGGNCPDDVEGACDGDEDFVGIKPIYYYPLRPQVEARLTAPCNYGAGQDECATVPGTIQIGWSSPVQHAAGDGDVAFPPEPLGVTSEEGKPNGASTSWSLHDLLCAAKAASCRFNYSVPQC